MTDCWKDWTGKHVMQVEWWTQQSDAYRHFEPSPSEWCCEQPEFSDWVEEFDQKSEHNARKNSRNGVLQFLISLDSKREALMPNRRQPWSLLVLQPRSQTHQPLPLLPDGGKSGIGIWLRVVMPMGFTRLTHAKQTSRVSSVLTTRTKDLVHRSIDPLDRSCGI